jgi:hypothetical protein
MAYYGGEVLTLSDIAEPQCISPKMLGAFFCPVEGFHSVKEVNLKLFYHLGGEMRFLRAKTDNLEAIAEKFSQKREWIIKAFIHTEQVPCPKTHEALGSLDSVLFHAVREAKRLSEIKVKDESFRDRVNEQIEERLRVFEDEFEHESRRLAVFAVTSKGDKDIRILIENAEAKFPKELLAVMPAKSIADIQEAGRCLAFERATACAFHICRATEALMLAYYEHLAGSPWPPPPMRKDWTNYNNQLKAKGAPDRITTRLEEIGRMDRNAYAHPDLTVALDEAPIVYELCTGVMFLIAKEML